MTLCLQCFFEKFGLVMEENIQKVNSKKLARQRLQLLEKTLAQNNQNQNGASVLQISDAAFAKEMEEHSTGQSNSEELNPEFVEKLRNIQDQ